MERKAIVAVRTLSAFRIGEARCWFGLGTHKIAPLKLERFELGPRLALAGKVKCAADGVGIGLRVRAGNRARFIKAQLAVVDDEQALGVTERRGAVAGRQAP